MMAAQSTSSSALNSEPAVSGLSGREINLSPCSFLARGCGFAYAGATPRGVPTPLPRLGPGRVVGAAENTTRDPTCEPPVFQAEAVIWRNGNVRVLPPNQSGRQISGICCAHRDNRDARSWANRQRAFD